MNSPRSLPDMNVAKEEILGKGTNHHTIPSKAHFKTGRVKGGKIRGKATTLYLSAIEA